MKIFLRIILNIVVILYILLTISLYIINAKFTLHFEIFSLLAIMILLALNYFVKKEMEEKPFFEFILYLFFVPCIFPLISVLFFRIFRNNFFLALLYDIPIGIYSSILFFILDYFLKKAYTSKKLYLIRLFIIIPRWLGYISKNVKGLIAPTARIC